MDCRKNGRHGGWDDSVADGTCAVADVDDWERYAGVVYIPWHCDLLAVDGVSESSRMTDVRVWPFIQ